MSFIQFTLNVEKIKPIDNPDRDNNHAVVTVAPGPSTACIAALPHSGNIPGHIFHWYFYPGFLGLSHCSPVPMTDDSDNQGKEGDLVYLMTPDGKMGGRKMNVRKIPHSPK